MSKYLLSNNNLTKIISFIPEANKLVLNNDIKEYISLVVNFIASGKARNDILKLAIELYRKNKISLISGPVKKVLCSKTYLYHASGIIHSDAGIITAMGLGYLMIIPSTVYNCYVIKGKACVTATSIPMLIQFSKTEGKNRWTKILSVELGTNNFCHLFIIDKYNLGYDISKWPAAPLKAYWEAVTKGIPTNKELVRKNPLRGINQFRLSHRELIKMSDDFRKININPSMQMKKIQNNRMKSIGKANVGLNVFGDELPF